MISVVGLSCPRSQLSLVSVVFFFHGWFRWQTETGGICITPRPSEEGAEIVGGKAMRPMFGIQPALVDEKVLAEIFVTHTEIHMKSCHHLRATS